MCVNWLRIMRNSLMASLLAVLLMGCSATRLAYNNAHELAWWWLTDYLEFTSEQRPAMRQSLVQVHAWHRRQQLPGYAEMLERWQGLMPASLTAAQVCNLIDEGVARLEDLAGAVDAMEPAALQVLASLSPQQLSELERRMTQSNREYREKYIDVTPRELAAERLKQGLSRADTLYGSLQAEQKRALQEALARSPWDTRASYERRLRRQQAVLQTLRSLQGAGSDQVRARLKALIPVAIDGADAADRAASQAFRRAACPVLAELHNSTTPAQRARAVENLQRYGADLRLLAQAAP